MGVQEATSIDVEENVGGYLPYRITYSIDPEMEQELVELINEKLNVTTQTSNCCIYRVPKTLFKENPAAYIPQMVSIGPFHHDKLHLRSMEPFKMCYFTEFLERRSASKLENYINAVTNLRDRAFQFYSGLKVDRMTSFVMMMVVDGGFILGLLLKIMDDKNFRDDKLGNNAFVDLILFENQLPFFILEELYGLLNIDDAKAPSLTHVIRRTLVPIVFGLLVGKDTVESFSNGHESPPHGSKPKHLLDLVWQFLIPSSLPDDSRVKLQGMSTQEVRSRKGPLRLLMAMPKPKKSRKRLLDCASPTCVLRWLCPFLCQEGDRNPEGSQHANKYNMVEPMRCATELAKGNVKFVEKKDPRNLLDIHFDPKKGVLTIPGMIIDRGIEVVLRNLVVYEQYTNDYSYITEYAAFLDDLIISVNDAELLQKCGIIDIGDPGEVARIFDQLVKGVAVPCYYTNPVRLQLEKHYMKPWNKWKAGLMLQYFNSPWALISFFAAVFAFILTVVQTICSIMLIK